MHLGLRHPPGRPSLLQPRPAARPTLPRLRARARLSTRKSPLSRGAGVARGRRSSGARAAGANAGRLIQPGARRALRSCAPPRPAALRAARARTPPRRPPRAPEAVALPHRQAWVSAPPGLGSSAAPATSDTAYPRVSASRCLVPPLLIFFSCSLSQLSLASG